MMEGPSEWQYMDRDDTTTSNMDNSLFLGHFWTNTQHSRQAERKEGEKREREGLEMEVKKEKLCSPSFRLLVLLFSTCGKEGKAAALISSALSVCCSPCDRGYSSGAPTSLCFPITTFTHCTSYHMHTHTPSLIYISAALF